MSKFGAVGAFLVFVSWWRPWVTWYARWAIPACSAGSYPCSTSIPGHGRVDLDGPEEALALLGLPPFHEDNLKAHVLQGASHRLSYGRWWVSNLGLFLVAVLCGVLADYLSTWLSRLRRQWRASKAAALDARPRALIAAGDRPTCHICLGLFVGPVTSPCGHSFCRVCYKQMLLGLEAPKCFCGEELPLAVPPINVALRDIMANAYPEQTRELELRARQEEAELDEQLSCCGGYKPGDHVVALVSRTSVSNVNGMHTTLRFDRGDEGIVLGLAPGNTARRTELRCRFPSYPSAIVKLVEICEPLPGGFKPGDQVISTINYSWPGGLTLAIGDVGEVTGPATDAALDKKQQVRCKFLNNPDVNVFRSQIKLKGVAGGFNVGDAIVLLLTAGNLKRGDEGEVIGPAGPTLDLEIQPRPATQTPPGGAVADDAADGEAGDAEMDWWAGTDQPAEQEVEPVPPASSPSERIRCRFNNGPEEDLNVCDICARLPGKFKPGDAVVSLIHEVWPGGLRIENGHVGEVIGPAGEAAVDRGRQVRCQFPENPDVNIFIDQIRLRHPQ